MINYISENWIAIAALLISLVNSIISLIAKQESKQALLIEKNSELRIKYIKMIDSFDLEIKQMEDVIADCYIRRDVLQEEIKNAPLDKNKQIQLNKKFLHVENKLRESNNIKTANQVKSMANNINLSGGSLLAQKIDLTKSFINEIKETKEILVALKEVREHLASAVESSYSVKIKSLSDLAELNGLADTYEQLFKSGQEKRLEMEKYNKSLEETIS
jgi:hypothetical protein